MWAKPLRTIACSKPHRRKVFDQTIKSEKFARQNGLRTLRKPCLCLGTPVWRRLVQVAVMYVIVTKIQTTNVGQSAMVAPLQRVVQERGTGMDSKNHWSWSCGGFGSGGFSRTAWRRLSAQLLRCFPHAVATMLQAMLSFDASRLIW